MIWMNISRAASVTSIAIEKESSLKDIKQRIVGTIAVVFDLDNANIPDNASPDLIEKWDSVNHMNLILALEEEFNIRFSDDELTQLDNINIIHDVVSSKVLNS